MPKLRYTKKNLYSVRVILEKILNAKLVDTAYTRDVAEQTIDSVLNKIGWTKRRPKFLVTAELSGTQVARINVDVWTKMLVLAMMKQVNTLFKQGNIGMTEAMREQMAAILGYIGDSRVDHQMSRLRLAVQKELDEQEGLQATNAGGDGALANGRPKVQKTGDRAGQALARRVASGQAGRDAALEGSGVEPPVQSGGAAAT